MPLLFSFGKEVFTMRLLRLGPVAALLVLLLCLAGCQAAEQAVSSQPESMASAAAETPAPTPAPTPGGDGGLCVAGPCLGQGLPAAGKSRILKEGETMYLKRLRRKRAGAFRVNVKKSTLLRA